MEKFKLQLEYKVGKTVYSTNLFETEHFKIEYQAFCDHLVLKLHAAMPLTVQRLAVTVPYTFSQNDRVFLNGYQSWTDCREYFIDDKPPCLAPYVKPYVMATSMCAAGDYTFVEYDKRPGYFHGFSYGYVRRAEAYDLFASLNERTGYTVFRFNCPDNTVTVEKDLEGITLTGDYEVLNFVHLNGTEDAVFDKWFNLLGIPKATAPVKNGYTTWYNYYPNINETIVNHDLEALSKVDADIDIFQIDDGYQTNVGDWLSVDVKKFPCGMKVIADKIHKKGMQAGLWLAPFAAQYVSEVAKAHPDWIIRHKSGKPVRCGLNWGGFYALDIENPEVREHIRHFFDIVLNDWGYDLVKLDFLYAAAIIPNHGKTRGQLMCEAMDFLRECVGEKQILGCGVPMMPAFGKVDYCRIGADMGLSWHRKAKSHREDVSTVHALGNTVFRRQLDGRAFRNDPDVFLLRENNMHCNFEQRKIIATVNKLFGSVLFTSDNVDDYNQLQMNALLKTFQKDDIAILRAEFSAEQRRVVEIEYTENGENKCFRFDLENGNMLSEMLDR